MALVDIEKYLNCEGCGWVTKLKPIEQKWNALFRKLALKGEEPETSRIWNPAIEGFEYSVTVNGQEYLSREERSINNSMCGACVKQLRNNVDIDLKINPAGFIFKSEQ